MLHPSPFKSSALLTSDSSPFHLDTQRCGTLLLPLSYPFTPELLARLAADTSVLALSPQTLPEAEVTVAALDLLIRDLRRRWGACVCVSARVCMCP